MAAAAAAGEEDEAEDEGEEEVGPGKVRWQLVHTKRESLASQLISRLLLRQTEPEIFPSILSLAGAAWTEMWTESCGRMAFETFV